MLLLGWELAQVLVPGLALVLAPRRPAELRTFGRTHLAVVRSHWMGC